MDRQPGDELTAAELHKQMGPFEPYTAAELAETLGAERGRIRTLLDRLSREKKVRTKKPKASKALWIREPPVHSCPECNREFEIKYLHPIFSAAQFCPRCGARL